MVSDWPAIPTCKWGILGLSGTLVAITILATKRILLMRSLNSKTGSYNKGRKILPIRQGSIIIKNKEHDDFFFQARIKYLMKQIQSLVVVST